MAQSSSSSSSSNTTVEQSGHDDSLPPLSALFLIKFDQKVGYVLSWKRSVGEVPLDGAVEFKSLPSGLHTVKNDLVYFVHENYAGLSAFANGPATEAERNAHFVSVGILVPLSEGRLGRSWLHAPSLQKLGNTLANDATSTGILEEYWGQYGADCGKNNERPGPAPQGGAKGHRRDRALSTITAVIPSEQSLPPFHPALAIVQYIDALGPLMFRLHQAALLRKRILFVAQPPVKTTCEFVYNLSVLSSIPASVYDALPPGSEAFHRLRSLFAVGIHDIPYLETLKDTTDDEGAAAHGWVACTTDEIMATKTQLYDIIVEIPPTYDAAPLKRRWPRIRKSDGTPIRASHRDVYRYKILRHELLKYRNGTDSPGEGTHPDEHATQPLLANGNLDLDSGNELNEIHDEKIVEPMTWSQLAYSGFLWWASAGEKDAYIAEERNRDRQLLGDLADFLPSDDNATTPHELVQAGLHTAIIAYFHRITSATVNELAALVEQADEDEDCDESLKLTRDDLSRLGLDIWSDDDKSFVEDFSWLYFGKRVDTRPATLECCGLRVL